MAVKQTVVVVDDEKAVLEVLSGLLRAHGYDVLTFRSGSELLAAGLPEGPACILLDLKLPGNSGFEVFQQLRRQHPGVPVIFVTGHGGIREAVNAMKQGAFDFVEKPFDNEDLLARIDKAFRASDPVDSAPPIAVDQRLMALLTPRERLICQQLMLAKTSKMIGQELGISPRTVEFHRSNIMRKLGVGSLPELIALIQPNRTKE